MEREWEPKGREWTQMDQMGRARGTRKSRRTGKSQKNANAKSGNEEKLFFSIAGRFSLKSGGLNGSTFTEELLTIVLKKLRKKCHAEKQENRKNEPISIQKTTLFKTLGPNGTVITMV